MNLWVNNNVTLYLTEKGQKVLSDVFGESKSVAVFVTELDELGLWILVDDSDEFQHIIRLVRWDHFESAQAAVAVKQQPTTPSNVIGFRR